MTQNDDGGSLEFFKAQHQAFSETIAGFRGQVEMLSALLNQAFSSFEGNVEMQAQDYPDIACHKGCATCCTIRVVATAPEVLLVARYLRSADGALKQEGIDLMQRLMAADAITRGHDERQRVELGCRCPYIDKGACVIYPVRPLACRGHASYDKRACVDAALGRIDDIPYSVPHMTMRGLIQNAMQSALRDGGFAWAVYELNHALSLILVDEDFESAWLAGDDVFAPAMVTDISLAEMANTFDHLHGRTAP
jgi:Fe-S-cluster containining protein